MTNIGFISTRLAGVDGVSLETKKLVDVLTAMGHACYYCAGELEHDAVEGYLVPKMHFADEEIAWLSQEAFRTPNPPRDLLQRIYEIADELRVEIRNFVEKYDIQVLIPQNASTIPMNLSLGLAIRDFAERTQIPMICHHHDFYWERERFLNNGIHHILSTAFPPRGENIQHMVINTIAQKNLKAWFGLDSTYLPNVFDFDSPPPEPDAFANTFRSRLGLSDDDLIVLQPTRVIRRKAIEKGVELIRKLNDDRLIYLITGYEGDEKGGYGEWLREEADRSGIRYRFIADVVGDYRDEEKGIFSLWDIYPHAHFITYPSVIEGFGNALIETLYFRKPLVVHTYPIYLANIKTAGVQAVEFNYDITDDVLAQTRRLIDDGAYRDDMVEHNYQVGLEHFSYRVLTQVITTLLGNIPEDDV